MISLIEDVIRTCWNEWFPQRPYSQLHFAKIAGNSLLSGRVVILVFESRVPEPIMVVKFPRTSSSKSVVEQEHFGLKKIQAVFPNANTPRPLWLGDMGFTQATIETAVVGHLMGNMRSPWFSSDSTPVRQTVGEHFDMALDWLACFHKRTTMGYTRHLIDCPSTDYVPPYYVACKTWLMDRFSAALKGQEVPLVCEHGDYWAGNLYVQHDKQIGVIDWVSMGWEQPPLFDAAFFVTSYALGFTPKKDNPLWMFHKLLDPHSWYAKLAESTLMRYMNYIGMPHVDMQYLVGMALLRRVLAEQQQPFHHNNIYSQMLDYWIQTFIGKGHDS
jgi:hypothetical protein